MTMVMVMVMDNCTATAVARYFRARCYASLR
jgi:hypothetical protein